jgi:hypothetical protein
MMRRLFFASLYARKQASIWLLLLIEKIALSFNRVDGTLLTFVRLYSRQIDRLQGHGERVAPG